MNNQTSTKRLDPDTLARLRRRMKRAGVTQKSIADSLGVTHFHVCNVLAGRDVSGPVLRRAKELLTEARLARSRNSVVAFLALLLLACR